jgi:hypothetical protein
VLAALVAGGFLLSIYAMAWTKGALDPLFNIGFWYALPVLTLACAGLGVYWHAHPPRWLVLVASLPPLAWIALAHYMRRFDTNVTFLHIEAVVLGWCLVAVVALLLASAVPRASRIRTGVAHTALWIPTPIMAFVLLMAIIWDVSHA